MLRFEAFLDRHAVSLLSICVLGMVTCWTRAIWGVHEPVAETEAHAAVARTDSQELSLNDSSEAWPLLTAVVSKSFGEQDVRPITRQGSAPARAKKQRSADFLPQRTHTSSE